MMFDVTRLN
jgi:hypothetical protein